MKGCYYVSKKKYLTPIVPYFGMFGRFLPPFRSASGIGGGYS